MEGLQPVRSLFTRFFQLEAASGLLLIAAAVLALIINNSPLSYLYGGLLEVPVAVQVGALNIAKPLLLWINDGLMALFFLLIGLEVKREVVDGHLSKPSQVILPATAAVGGMVVPALIYWFINRDNPAAVAGWAIPTATDIAFALGVLALLGKRVPVSLKLFLMTLAIIDDLGAIIVIALFYSGTLSSVSLLLAAACLLVLVAMNRLGVIKLGPYMIVGLILWVCVLKSGVHATLAGVALAFCIPLRTRNAESSPLLALEHALHPWVAYAILPIFAFANAGVSLAGMTVDSFTHPVPMGITIGLLLGKTVGVFGLTWVAVKLRLAALPAGAGWGQILGVAILCGIGFTMSLFVGSLAFAPGSSEYAGMDRMGILTGSFFAAVIGYAVTAMASRKTSIA
ncbi:MULTISPECIES: Na+/H+ antiporter NhaA [Pseudomonas]|jgi:NhaA family Na+:H+ antiporter|uniref:Na(+)/H(+) antiporter NhaA 1 n=2 Tax=Pseudomonas putida group TaxID=136845 RepID=NHAA1_PSEPK|nr:MULTISPECIES: Na+/H+ antiporter NhaA [Pseudomonas]Q88NS2.1 RecName: Full=Na(+)/H(+) antiporter NhaA 1; AltName: Full=Sodium/proton antiporter NhaA 1 [Pseudomonas putida KT2440]AAN66757.1 Na(+)/H(+) antiporter NhaA 1 [Pseudomonas putida KT2440]MBP2842605.1 Na+/H+ antiporter NhaA [Pseudomonas sp. PNP]MCE0862241.1 Na+/H+ antiporter NhaA [Pseudomonas alloputida]MCE0868321.1 Na+/H+ antiporter NhaA [Pseudomonas alloputida]MCE0891697.1 Na+/H+ antiporter NhaA [Pseudomonas alloputida]